MKSIYQMELEDKFNRKIKYREKKLKNQRMIIGKQQEEIERLNNIIKELEKDIKKLYTYGIKNNAEQRDYLLNRLEELKEYKGSDINEISHNLYELPLYHEFIEMMSLFNKTYDTCLIAGTKDEVK